LCLRAATFGERCCSSARRSVDALVRTGSAVCCAELAAIASILGRLPTAVEYLQNFGNLSATAADTYRYLNFDQLPDYVKSASNVDIPQELRDAAKKQYS
jgi:aconitase B